MKTKILIPTSIALIAAALGLAAGQYRHQRQMEVVVLNAYQSGFSLNGAYRPN